MPMSKNGPGFGFKVSPRLLAPLGIEQLQDPALAVLELIKNSWDADAKRVAVEVRQRASTPTIVVKDNGSGMSREDFRDRWLVIGASYKREKPKSELSRPMIGEKGLGRLASYALGSCLSIESTSARKSPFLADINWDAFFRSTSVEDYKIHLKPSNIQRGTKVTISGLRGKWTEKHTDLLSTYTQFLTSVPGQVFDVSLKVDGVEYPLSDPFDAISSFAEGSLEMVVNRDGVPEITGCRVNGVDYSWVSFRNFKAQHCEPRLVGLALKLTFYLRNKIAQKLSNALASNDVNDLLEQYQGVRVYRDGINVPPYGLHGDDWAGLEKQRTKTGGPTMVPGNSQLVGELHIPASVKHLSITAGRSGFADQEAVSRLAEYVRWAVRELGTARRAHDLGLKRGQGSVPARVDASAGRRSETTDRDARKALAQVGLVPAVRQDPELRQKFERAKDAIEEVLGENEATLRLYAQLASTGIAATSFAHELRTDFDVVSEAVREIGELTGAPDHELRELLSGSWKRIKNFVALFRLVPVKSRRVRSVMDRPALLESIKGVSRLVPVDRVAIKSDVGKIRAALVPAELDAVLLNLVSNSVKAIAESQQADAGKIRVAVYDRGKDLIVSVLDNGCGVPDTVAQVMFEPLEGKFAEGTGMGLAIVRFIAERYKGSVTFIKPSLKGYAAQVDVVLRGVVQ